MRSTCGLLNARPRRRVTSTAVHPGRAGSVFAVSRASAHRSTCGPSSPLPIRIAAPASDRPSTRGAPAAELRSMRWFSWVSCFYCFVARATAP